MIHTGFCLVERFQVNDHPLLRPRKSRPGGTRSVTRFRIDNHCQWFARSIDRPWIISLLLTLIFSPLFSDTAPEPVFSLTGGFYHRPQQLTLSSNLPGASIRYTLGGRPPDPSSPLYQDVIRIEKTTAIRARTFVPGLDPGEIVTQTIFIDEPVSLPVISLVFDPDDFFDDEIGIYVIGTQGVPGYCSDTPHNVNMDWERPLNIEFYEPSGTQVLNQGAGVKIFGGCSRTRYPQKSLALYARAEYGKGSFKAQLFPDKPIRKFESFILRAAGDDQVHTFFREALTHVLVKDVIDMDVQAYRPVVVFFNGEYWGIHNLREKLNEHYPAGNYNLDPEDIDILKRDGTRSYNIVSGENEDYVELMNFVESHNLSDPENYRIVEEQMDVNQFLNYQVTEIYLTNGDWPGNNIKFWKAWAYRHDRWRWLLYDMDGSFSDIYQNTLQVATQPDGPNWPNPPWSTLLFRKLLENDWFRNEFIQRHALYANTIFHPDRVIPIIDSLQANIAAEIPRHIDRWGGQRVPDPESWIRPTFASVRTWESNVNVLRSFARNRPKRAEAQVIAHFDLSGSSVLTVDVFVRDGGILEINGREVPPGFSGRFFNEVPLTISAHPIFGFRFSHWQIREQRIDSEKSLRVSPSWDQQFIAHFTEDKTASAENIVITEINYHSPESFNPDDWIELYNAGHSAVDLSGWSLLDSQDDHVYFIPRNQLLKPDSYLVLCQDLKSFRYQFPDVRNCIGNFLFGLDGSGESIRLFRPDGLLIDSVFYRDQLPWPPEADGQGPTLELIHPDSNNTTASNWNVSKYYGSPGRTNDNTKTGVSIDQALLPREPVLFQNFPNPFNPSTTLSYSIHRSCRVRLTICDLLGRQRERLWDGYQGAGSYSIPWRPENLPSGVYVLILEAGNFLDRKKLLYLK